MIQTVPMNGTPQQGGKYIECSNPRCGACTALMIYARNEDAVEAVLARWNRRLTDPDQDARDIPPAPRFPVALRKMWSGQEIQEWIDQQWAKP